MRSARAIFLLLIAYCLLLIAPKQTFAQAQNPYPSTSVVNQFTTPNVDSNVPQNQHIYAQSVTIEVMSALICQISGIDPIDPAQGCLGVNPQTRKLGLIKPQLDADGKPALGGMLGVTTDMIAMTYQQPATTGLYTEYVAGNFGLTKKAYAAEESYGFRGLRPILKLWEAVRNVAYMLLTLAFVLIGLGVMLRVKIDPRTVMTIQNQIPKVIMAIILITFSYAISALMIDLMWTTTYAGVNLLTYHFPKEGETLTQKANKDIMNNPLSFTNQIFETGKNGPFGAGVFHITQDVSNNVGELLRGVVKELLGVDDGEKCFGGLSGLFGKSQFVNFSACAAGLLAFLASVTLKLVILVILMVTLFRLWFQLLKAYVFTIVYIIISPVYIVFGLLPSKPLGLEKWLRALFVNLATFPVTAFVLVAAKLLMDLYETGVKTGQTLFVPPLVGNTHESLNFGSLLAFGAILVAPSLNTILKEKMGVKGIGSPGLVAAGVAGGAAVIGGPAGRAMKHLNRRDSRNQAVGALAVGREKAGNWALNRASESKYNPFKNATSKKLAQREFMQTGDYASGRQTLREWREENLAERGNYFQRRRRRNGGNNGGGPSGTGGGGPTPPTGSAPARVGVIRRAGQGMGRLGRRIIRRPDRDERGSSTPTIFGRGKPKSESPSTPETAKSGTDFKMHSTVPAGASGHIGEGQGSVQKGQDGEVTITGPVTATGHVTIAGGANAGAAKQGFIGKKYDEYLGRLQKAGEKPVGSKQNITIHLEEMLKDKGSEDISKMHEPEWERLFKEAEEKEKGKNEGDPHA